MSRWSCRHLGPPLHRQLRPPGHRGNKFPSTALMDPMTKSFVADIHHFTEAHGLDLVHFGKERKDDLTQRYLAGCPARAGVLYVGRGQEKAVVWST